MPRRALIAALAALLSGCCLLTPDKIELDSRWRPLLAIEQSDRGEAGVFWTDGRNVYTADLCDFTGQDETTQGGILTHERLHAVRRAAHPGSPEGYDLQYSREVAYRRAEEQIAWEAQIAYVIRKGGEVEAEFVARFLSEHYGAGARQGIMSYEEALAWVNGVIAQEKAGR